MILGGGFAGVYPAHRLERLLRGRPDVSLTLVSRDNFFLMTPLLFEACSGILEYRHCSLPTRTYLRRARFVEACVSAIELDARIVRLSPGGAELGYDQLVLALGAQTDVQRIPGSLHAFTFKTLTDAMVLRNHVIECFEPTWSEISVESDAHSRSSSSQHAIREAKVLAENIAAHLHGRRPRPFLYETLGIMASLGHRKGIGRILFIRVRGFVAWWIRRTYYLLQMPKLSRKARIVVDWTVAVFFRPDTVKVDLAREHAKVLGGDRRAGEGDGRDRDEVRPLTDTMFSIPVPRRDQDVPVAPSRPHCGSVPARCEPSARYFRGRAGTRGRSGDADKLARRRPQHRSPG